MVFLIKKETNDSLQQLQLAIHYHFEQVKLLNLALTHTSAANEMSDGQHNERLEFLGDAVLELCISQELYKRFPQAREGMLTAMRSQLVNQQSLAKLARSLSLDKLLKLGKGEENQGGRKRDTLLCDVFEALLGAIYLDGGFIAAEMFISKMFCDKWPKLNEKKRPKDFKSRLQEVSHATYKQLPMYTLLSSSGPEHNKVFIVRLDLPNGKSIESSGSSMKRAEQAAACQALKLLKAT